MHRLQGWVWWTQGSMSSPCIEVSSCQWTLQMVGVASYKSCIWLICYSGLQEGRGGGGGGRGGIRLKEACNNE